MKMTDSGELETSWDVFQLNIFVNIFQLSMCAMI